MIRGVLEAIGITVGFIALGLAYYQMLSAQVASEACAGLATQVVSESGAGVTGVRPPSSVAPPFCASKNRS